MEKIIIVGTDHVGGRYKYEFKKDYQVV